MIVTCLLVALASSLTPPPTEILPSAAANVTLAHALAGIENLYQYIRPGTPSAPERLAIVDAALDRLVEDLGEKTAEAVAAGEGRSLAAKLVAIGLDRRRHPAAYEVLGTVYGNDKSTGEGGSTRAGPRMVLLRDEHVRAAYRLAWEYRLLVFPGLREVGPRVVRRLGTEGMELATSPTFEALTRVGREESIVTLCFYFRHMCRDDLDGKGMSNDREQCLDVLESYRSPRALLGLLECAEWAEVQWARRPPVIGPRGGTPAAWLKLLLDDPALRDKWRAAAAVVATGPLTARQRAMLAPLLADNKAGR